MKKYTGVIIWAWMTPFIISTHYIGESWLEGDLQAFICGWVGIGLPAMFVLGYGITRPIDED